MSKPQLCFDLRLKFLFLYNKRTFTLSALLSNARLSLRISIKAKIYIFLGKVIPRSHSVKNPFIFPPDKMQIKLYFKESQDLLNVHSVSLR